MSHSYRRSLTTPSTSVGTDREVGRPVDRARGLHLVSARCWVAPALVVDRPLLSDLFVEDTAWQVATEAWQRRRPPWWHRAERAAWRAEGEQLTGKAVRLVAQARELGLRPTPDAPPRRWHGRRRTR